MVRQSARKNLSAIVRAEVSEFEGISTAKEEFCGIIEQLLLAYSDVIAIFGCGEEELRQRGLFIFTLISAKDVVSAFRFAGTMMRCG